jgi:hypothetical protein
LENEIENLRKRNLDLQGKIMFESRRNVKKGKIDEIEDLKKRIEEKEELIKLQREEIENIREKSLGNRGDDVTIKNLSEINQRLMKELIKVRSELDDLKINSNK